MGEASAVGRNLGELELTIEPGFTVLAIERAGRYLYRPRRDVRLQEHDMVLASGPEEGTESLAGLLGCRHAEGDGGEREFEPLTSRSR